MKIRVFAPLILTIILSLIIAAFSQEVETREIKRRSPSPQLSDYYGDGRLSSLHERPDYDVEELSDINFQRRRRIPYYFPALHSKSFWKRILPSAGESDIEKKKKRDAEEFANNFNRRRRNYPLYPGFTEDDTAHFLGENQKKRGIMYYYPNYRYAFFDDPNEDNGDVDAKKKKRTAKKRQLEGGLMETLRNDDPADMGYD